MKLTAPEVSGFALGQFSFENRSLCNVKRRRDAHGSLEHKLQPWSRNVCKAANRPLETSHISTRLFEKQSLCTNFVYKTDPLFLRLKSRS